MMKNRIENVGLKIFNKHSKLMGMEDGENVSGKSIKSKAERVILPVHKWCHCLYSLRREAECWRLDSGFQVFLVEEYPFHAVKYSHWDFRPLCERTASTSYSSSFSMMLGGGFKKVGPCASVKQ